MLKNQLIMFDIHDHKILFVAIIVLSIIIIAIIGIFMYFVNSKIKSTNYAIYKMLEYHDTFYTIDTGIDEKVERIIRRQGQLAKIIRSLICDLREHDKKVQALTKELGVQINNGDDKNPGS